MCDFVWQSQIYVANPEILGKPKFLKSGDFGKNKTLGK